MFGCQNVVIMVAIYSILACGEQGNEIKRSISNGTAVMIGFQERIHQIGAPMHCEVPELCIEMHAELPCLASI
jgi:hypothetical protein